MRCGVGVVASLSELRQCHRTVVLRLVIVVVVWDRFAQIRRLVARCGEGCCCSSGKQQQQYRCCLTRAHRSGAVSAGGMGPALTTRQGQGGGSLFWYGDLWIEIDGNA